MSCVILFSMYDPDASKTIPFAVLTIFDTDPSALLTLATSKVTFLSRDPPVVAMNNALSPSFSTVLPSVVVWNTPRLDLSHPNVLWFRNRVLGMTVSAAPLSITSDWSTGVHLLAISHSGSIPTALLSRISAEVGSFLHYLCFCPVLLLSRRRILCMTRIHHSRSQTALPFSRVLFSSCRPLPQ